MKIIKKLCIPLLSLVLVLSCFSVSQMDASAAMSANDRIGPGHNQGGGDPNYPSGISYPAERENVICSAHIEVPEGYSDICSCYGYRDNSVTYPDNGPPYGLSGYCIYCRHSFFDHHLIGGGGGAYLPGGGGSNSHTHNYSTTWGAWRKISSCRLPG